VEKTFKDFNLKNFIASNLEKVGIIHPTEIQSQTISLILEGRDVIGKAKTGTGKTLAYLLPMIEGIDPQRKELQMLVLAPTRELSLQIQREAENVIKDTGIKIASIVEGMDINRQLEKLKEKPHIVIATPGRLVHIIGLRKIKTHAVRIIALDEVDQMLQQGLMEKVQAVVSSTLKDRQIVSFSATVSQNAKTTLEGMMKDPVFINLDHIKPIPSKIQHQYIVSKSPKKTDTLIDLIKDIKPEKSLVFINKNENVDRFVKELVTAGLSAGGIQTRTKNQERQHLITSFNKGKLKVLVTTDLFTRGMDFSNVTHIFNMDLPLNPVDYLHRAGRTGRMGKEGLVINIVRDKEKFVLYKMMRHLNINVTAVAKINGKIVEVDRIIRRKKERE
jgi:ATP-dependent RNA helicase DeaD